MCNVLELLINFIKSIKTSDFIAGLALAFTAWQMYIQRKHNQKMSQPHLSGWNHQGHDPESYIFSLENVGLGPAIIKKISLRVEGKEITGEGSDLIQNAIPKIFHGIDYGDPGWEMFSTGEMIPSGKKYHILTVHPLNSTSETITSLMRKNARLVIHYESILGEKFLFDSEKD